MSDTFVLGKDAKVYRNTNTYGSPTWVEIDIVMNVTVTLDKGEFMGATRGSGGWEQSAGTLKKLEAELEMLFKPADAGYRALRDSFLNNTMIDLMILTGPRTTADTEGPRAEMEVFSLPRDEKLQEGVTIKAKVKPRISSNAIAWVTN